MDGFWKQHCRLCLDPVTDKDFEEIKDITRNFLDILLLELNFDGKSKYIMCNECSRKIMEAFKFKWMCLDTDDSITPYIDDETGCSVDLKDIYIKETGKKHLINAIDDYKVCRLCMQLIKDEFKFFHEMADDVIEMYIPEINLTVIEDPVICKQCFDSFRSHSNFIKNCLEVNEKIKNSCYTQVVDNSAQMPTISYIKTEEVDIKSESEQEDEMLETEVETEDEISTASDFSKKMTYRINTNKFSGVRTYRCKMCDYKTKQKGHMNNHQLQHADPSEERRYECDQCTYKTNFKRYFKHHRLSHSEPSYKCDQCSYVSKTTDGLLRHHLVHKDPSEVEMLRCVVCL